MKKILCFTALLLTSTSIIPAYAAQDSDWYAVLEYHILADCVDSNEYVIFTKPFKVAKYDDTDRGHLKQSIRVQLVNHLKAHNPEDFNRFAGKTRISNGTLVFGKGLNAVNRKAKQYQIPPTIKSRCGSKPLHRKITYIDNFRYKPTSSFEEMTSLVGGKEAFRKLHATFNKK